jgi:hypothetical protein
VHGHAADLEARVEVIVLQLAVFADVVIGIAGEGRALAIGELRLEVVVGDAANVGAQEAPANGDLGARLEHVGDDPRVVVEVSVVEVGRLRGPAVRDRHQVGVAILDAHQQPVAQLDVGDPSTSPILKGRARAGEG